MSLRRVGVLIVVIGCLGLNAPIHAQSAAVDWSDVRANRAAMKLWFADDVNAFVDANRYVIDGTLSVESDATVTGSEQVRYTNRAGVPLDQIVFRLYPNMDALGGEMTVSRAQIEGKSVDAQIDGSILIIPLASPLAPDAALVIGLDFRVFMQAEKDASYGRFGYKNGVVSGSYWYPTLSVYEPGKGWWEDDASPEGDPAYTETGLYDVHLTVPAGYQVAMSGVQIGTVQNADGTTTIHDVTGPMRDHIFMASARYRHISQEVNGTTINVYAYEDADRTATQKVLQIAATSVKTYTKVYGEYPFAEFDVVENPTPTGVEYPGLVQVAEREWNPNANYLEVIVCHETAHQWFYSLVGDDQVNHPWLDESFAAYSEFVYWRAAHPNSADRYIAAKQNALTLFLTTHPDQPLDLPVTSYSGSAYGAIVYTKGPLFLVELEKELGGPQVVYAVLHEYFQRERYRITNSAALLDAFEHVTHKDLSTVFARWVGPFIDYRLF